MSSKEEKKSSKEILDRMLNRACGYLPLIKRSKVGPSIMVTGTQRSGSTWVGTILAQSQDISWVYEPFNSEFGYLLEDTECSVCGYEIKYRFSYPESQDYSKYVNHIRHIMNSKSLMFKRSLLKSPFGLFHIEMLMREFDIRPVILIRNPLGYVSSIIQKGKTWKIDFNTILEQQELMSKHLSEFEDEIKDLATRSHSILENAMLMYKIFNTYLDRFAQANDLKIHRLEDISSDPYSKISEICSDIEIEMTDQINTYIKTSTSAKNPTKESSEKVHHLLRNSKEIENVWKYRIGEKQVAKILSGTKSIAQKYYPEYYK